ncbi:TIGR04211 family SH3 domain-containing protein [Poseidonibacter ostreae]|jgi:SH3 domain protein|uniref:TIGR04211 family SH3 domain-containing protein n=1 Tax=Poseidonibacter ostreae TaxID=2654171 RepID=A0A6L4WW31_9BACT|nr:TIGR04211 family SH3 domain-containing protein [Poseidonibacter ostreae]KAB7887348.1 TIGR04211 family SH3 domain-containing protein [Poseidonibacter ostreae]KAB7890074.1 TIGR04211 family SH3 domain-containing protein [Poseidonibacter ostreae]KAB7890807.1 TIGR04211 family SH3 domain-containing protein [Poseidonibacter ostreae]MAC83930.1 arylsulfatase [Arcobacter sp.]|tara:strand:+ start:1981 stop:2547 length:567 start_codon:yes stop_codon:yes gene_type:complete
MRKINFLLLLLISLSSSASAATYYVSDDLHTFIHSGPSTKYKIVGSVNSGERIKIIRKDSNFTLVKDSKGRSGWINSKYVSNQQGLKERLPKLENKLAELKIQLEEYEKDIESKATQITTLKNTNTKLNKQLEEIQIENNDLNATLDMQKNDLLMRWFSYGGMVAGAGLLLGLIIPLLIPNRRNRSRF